MGVNGVTDFEVAKNAANGIIEMIRLANGIEGEKALPEEFAHFAIEAMGDNPLINRLINYLHSTGLVEEILGDEFETYNTLYEGNNARLAKEAAGKLLAKHLLQSEIVTKKPYKNILERVINAIKSFFKTINATPIQKALYEADKEFGILAMDILTGRLDDKIDVGNINYSGLLYQTNERVQRDRKLLQNIINNELKRLKVYEKRNPNSNFDTNQRLLIDKLEVELASNQELEGIYSFLNNALETLNLLNNRLLTISEEDTDSLAKKATVLRDIRNYIYSYENIINEIREALLEEERYPDNRYGERVRVVLDNTTTLINDLHIKYDKAAMPLFVDFIKPFLGQNVVIPFGEYKGKILKAEELIKRAESDISFFDRWLDSMADSSDYMAKIMAQGATA